MRIKEENPSFPILIRECNGILPCVWARYGMYPPNSTSFFKLYQVPPSCISGRQCFTPMLESILCFNLLCNDKWVSTEQKAKIFATHLSCIYQLNIIIQQQLLNHHISPLHFVSATVPQSTRTVKYLGALDKHLTWKSHIKAKITISTVQELILVAWTTILILIGIMHCPPVLPSSMSLAICSSSVLSALPKEKSSTLIFTT